MSRSGEARPRAGRTRWRPGLEALEGRSLPSVDFISAFGIGVTGANSTIRSNAVATDAAGDSYITGSFRGTASFDPNSSSATFTTNKTQDAFVAKYGPTGALLWAKTFAGKSTTTGTFTTYAVGQGSAIAVDGSGDVFVSGGYSGTVDLSGASSVTEITTPTSTTYAYLAKLDPSGNLDWVDTVTGTATDTDESYALALDNSGGAVIAGSFSDAATFGKTTLTAAGVSEAFAARIDSSGRFLWAVATQGTAGSNAGVLGAAIDGSGNVDLAGFFSRTVDFDPGSGITDLASTGPDYAFLWKLDANGHFVWARGYGSADSDFADAVAIDASGDLYATGTFSDTVNFGTASRPDSLSTQATYNAFVLKLDPYGNEVWVKGFISPTGSSEGQGIAVDHAGNVSIAGEFHGMVDFDPGPGLDNLTSVGYTDAFVSGLDPTGNLLYAIQAGKTASNTALGAAVDAMGDAVITGTYSGSIAFGPFPVPAIGVGSLFVARVRASPPPGPPAPSLEASSDTGVSQSDGITSDASPVFDVTTAYGANVVDLLRNGVVVGSRIGSGPIQDSGPIADGTYTYTAIQISTNSVSSPAGPGSFVTIITRPPSTPSAPTLDATDDSGVIGDGITNVKQPHLSVVAKANTTVQIQAASGLAIGSIFAPSDGMYSLTPDQPLPDGVYTLQARATDLAGNVGPLGPTFTLTILTSCPAPAAPSLLLADDSGGPGLTNVRQPRLTGTAAMNGSVQIVGPSGVIPVVSATGADGSYIVKLASPLADGVYLFYAVATDVAGNVSPPGPAFSLTILATPPAAPSVPTLLPQDDSGTPGDDTTNVVEPRLTGSAVPGLAVRLVNASNIVLGTATAAPGTGSLTISPSTPLPNGTNVLHFVAIDAAGNTSVGASITLVIMSTSPPTPTAPGLLPADDTGVLNDGITTVRRPKLVGIAAPGGRIDWIAANGSVLVSTTASAVDGSYQLQLNSALVNGIYPVRVQETDIAGNVSPTSLAFNLTIRATTGDDFGDGRTDLAVIQPNTTVVSIQEPTSGALYTRPYGSIGDVPIDGDFFGNGHADVAVYRPSTSTFYVLDPVTNAFVSEQFGQPGDVPVPADYDGDGKTDFAVFRASTDTFIIQLSASNTLLSHIFAIPGDVPVPADYFGNGHADIAVYRPSTSTFYYIDPISWVYRYASIGPAGSIPVPGDYEGLGHADLAVFQPADATFTIQLSATNAVYSHVFGYSSDIPVPGDYFGDGRTDLAVFRQSNATFYSLDIANGAYQVNPWGTPGVVKPLLAPITTWFTFGGSTVSRTNAARKPVVGAIPSETLLVPIPPESTDPSPVSPPAGPSVGIAADQPAARRLSLERWRPFG